METFRNTARGHSSEVNVSPVLSAGWCPPHDVGARERTRPALSAVVARSTYFAFLGHSTTNSLTLSAHGALLTVEPLPSLPEEGMKVTFSLFVP